VLDLDRLDFAKGGGLVTVVTQDAVSGAVLMVAHADRAALERTLESGQMHYHSRTRGLWRKGATSGNTQRVVSLAPDCDGDAVLARVVPAGPACHTGLMTCFDRAQGQEAVNGDALSALASTIRERAGQAANVDGDAGVTAARPSYTVQLLGDRNLRLKKLGEEAAELITACADGDAARATEEAADLVYHLLVALQGAGSSLAKVRRVLIERAKPSPDRPGTRP
jgi:phosphoribosyl-AMP cyclohydrolase / phosphoribosyl-ATP pyrophosphohydrolase